MSPKRSGEVEGQGCHIVAKSDFIRIGVKESDRRRYAAIEDTKLGHGGVEYISTLLGCDPKTIRQGLSELEGEAELDTGRSRKRGVDAGG